MSAPADRATARAGAGSGGGPLLELVLETFDDAVLVTEASPLDVPGPRIVYVNSAFTAMTGYASDEVLGRDCRFLQGPDTDPAARRTMRTALEAAERVQVELVNYRKDGSPFWVEILLTPLLGEDGAPTHFVSVQRETTFRKTAELDLERRVLHTPLTGLLNRTGFERVLSQVLASSPTRPPAVVLLDVAGLRNVNYTLGRKGGDELLLEVATRLRRLADRRMTLAQLEGGEFGLLVRDSTLPGVAALCERLRRSLLEPFTVLGTQLSPVTSGGVAIGEEASTAAALLREADVARRVAADAGAGRYELYEPDMGRSLEQRLDLDQGLRRAVGNGELLLHHQPVVDLRDGRTGHVEALVRWDRPDHGAVSPASFIPVAEASGAIVAVGAWVLREACRQASAWQDELPGVGVAVNLSPRQFAGADLAGQVAAALGGLPPALLTLEITEGALVTDPEAAAVQMERLARQGIRIALDDFGTGYSSLAYLKRLPVDALKIDKAFVDNLVADTGDRAIVRAVLALASDLGIAVVAEGVETRAQRRVLLDLGCTLAQGYLFARPVPTTELVTATAQAWAIGAEGGAHPG